MAPIFKNKPVQGAGANASAAYHGYWITDFTQVDPHFGTNDQLKELIAKAHAKGMKVFFDVITNHTADVIDYAQQKYDYRSRGAYPTLDATGAPSCRPPWTSRSSRPPAASSPRAVRQRTSPGCTRRTTAAPAPTATRTSCRPSSATTTWAGSAVRDSSGQLRSATGSFTTGTPTPTPLPTASSRPYAVVHYQRKDGNYDGWYLYAWGDLADGVDPVVKQSTFDPATGAFTVPARTVAVFVQH